MRNQAFAFIKPHAMKSQAIATYIGDIFEDGDVKVPFKKLLTGEVIAREKLIDRHFADVSHVAFLDDVAKLAITEAGRESFKIAFQVDWDAAVAAGKVVSGSDLCTQLDNLSPEDLCSMWAAYGAVEIQPNVFVSFFDEPGRYVLNGFYPVLRKGYVAPGSSLMLMLLDFEMDWHEFREAIIGCENPAAAVEESIRGYLYDRAAVLEMVIDPLDNILHVSASPVAALCEKMIWLDEAQWIEDPLLKQVSEKTGRGLHVVADWIVGHYTDSAWLAQFEDQDTERVAESLATMI